MRARELRFRYFLGLTHRKCAKIQGKVLSAADEKGIVDGSIAELRSIVMWNLLPGRACGTAAVEYRTRPRVWSALAGKQVAAR